MITFIKTTEGQIESLHNKTKCYEMSGKAVLAQMKTSLIIVFTVCMKKALVYICISYPFYDLYSSK